MVKTKPCKWDKIKKSRPIFPSTVLFEAPVTGQPLVAVLGPIAQSDVYSTDNQEVAIRFSSPAKFFGKDWLWNCFLGHSLPSADS